MQIPIEKIVYNQKLYPREKVNEGKVAEYDPCDIINIDQSPILYSFHSNRTLEMKGKRTVHVCASKEDTKRVTLTVTVKARGKMLPHMLIFKGVTNGRIANHDFVPIDSVGSDKKLPYC